MKKLAKKQTGGAAKASVKKANVAVEKNPQYRKSPSVADTYTKIKGSGPKTASKGTPAASNYKKGGTKKK